MRVAERVESRPIRRLLRADLPEAVGAVDRAVHPRLERDLGLVAALRAEDREVLAAGAGFVAARAAEVAGVVAAVAGGPSAGPAAHAALRLRGEALLCVVLLIVGGMDEFDAAVDASERSIDVGHRAASRARCQLGALRGIGVGTAGKARSRGRDPWCRCGVPWAGRTGVRSGEDTPDRRNGRFQGR